MKNALILGATSDIGTEICLQLAPKGYLLSIAGRDKEKLSHLATKLEGLSGHKTGVYDFEATTLKAHMKFYSSLKVKPDVVFCCVGHFDIMADSTSNEESAKLMSANFLGIVSILNVVVADFEQRRHGAIVVLSSVAADRGRQSNYMYGSAKAGLNAYLSGIRNRLHKSNVTVTTIKLGPVYTRMSTGQKLIPFLTAQRNETAAAIIRAFERKKDIIYYKPIWRIIMFLIRLLPENIFKRLPPF